MPGAVLHVGGEGFDPDGVLPSLSLRPYRIWRRGEPVAATGPRAGRIHESGGFCCEVSAADGLLADEAADALAFLAEHRSALVSLRDHPAVEDMRIDFGYYQRIDGERVVQCDYLGPELLRRAGELGVGFELSLYPAPEHEDAEPGAAPDTAR
jgi:hypothetical protein